MNWIVALQKYLLQDTTISSIVSDIAYLKIPRQTLEVWKMVIVISRGDWGLEEFINGHDKMTFDILIDIVADYKDSWKALNLSLYIAKKLNWLTEINSGSNRLRSWQIAFQRILADSYDDKTDRVNVWSVYSFTQKMSCNLPTC